MNIMHYAAQSRVPRINQFLFPVMVLLGLMGASQQVLAAVTCQPAAGAPLTLAPSINPSIMYAGQDLPNGSTIYRVQTQLSKDIGIRCDAAYNLTSYLTVTSEPLGSPTNMNWQYGTGPVYPTNVAGVGVVLWANQLNGSATAFSKAAPLKYQSFQLNGSGEIASNSTINISLVKTGPIGSGTVDVSKVPHISWYIPATSGYSGLPIQLMSASYSGSAMFVNQTCTTSPNMTVNMGKYDVTDSKFTQIGATTNWIDASIVLTGCPTFYGDYADHLPGQYQRLKDSAGASGGTRQPNLFALYITTTSSVSGNIVALEAGSNMATGVGLQLGYSDSVSASPTAPQTIWKPGDYWYVQAPSDGRTSMKLPLAARYYQTANTITPGQANAQIVVNIDYR